MAFSKKTWVARQGTGLNKFSIDGQTAVTVVNSPDSVTVTGDGFTAANMNGLETRIENAFSEYTGSDRKNLLHNTDFTNPVNQRKNICFPSGVSYYSSNSLDDYVGTLSDTQSATKKGSGLYTFISDGRNGISGTTYYIRLSQYEMSGTENFSATKKYCIDRWSIINSLLTTGSNGITWKTGSGSDEKSLFQITELSLKSGDTYTVSVNCRAVSATGSISIGLCNGNGQTLLSSQIITSATASLQTYTATFTATSDASLFGVKIFTTSPAEIIISSVKLERGSVSTLASDSKADYGEELAKCQRFYVKYDTSAVTSVLALGSWISYKYALAVIYTPQIMRQQPTMTIINDNYITLKTGGTTISPNSYSILSSSQNAVTIAINDLDGNHTEGSAVAICAGEYGAIEFSADI